MILVHSCSQYIIIDGIYRVPVVHGSLIDRRTFGCSATLSFFPMGSFPLLPTLPFFAALFFGILKFFYFFLIFFIYFLRKFFQKFSDRNQDLETINICLFVADDYSLSPTLIRKN